jgi:hypothetical protein
LNYNYSIKKSGDSVIQRRPSSSYGSNKVFTNKTQRSLQSEGKKIKLRKSSLSPFLALPNNPSLLSAPILYSNVASKNRRGLEYHPNLLFPYHILTGEAARL